jgi:hypothetical protein
MGNATSNKRNCKYTCANKLLKNIKFNYYEEAHLTREIFNEIYQNKIHISNYDLEKYGINIKIILLSRFSYLINNNQLNDKITDEIKKKFYDVISENIKKNFISNTIKLSKIIHYNDSLEITIDSYIFRLIVKKDNEDSRMQLLLSSRKLDNTNERMLLYYRSNSDGGIWRFAIAGNIYGSGAYYKNKSGKGGIDYITETIMHLKLQGFVFNNINKIPFSYFENEKNNNFNKIKDIYNKLDNGFFINNDNNYEKEDISNTNKLINNFNYITVDIFKFLKYEDKYEYFNILQRHIECGKNDGFSFDNMISFKDYFSLDSVKSEKYSKIMLEEIIKEFPDDTEDDTKIYNKIYYNILSNYLIKIGLKIINNNELEYITKYKATLDNCIIKFNVYSIKIQIENDIFILYCALYRIWNKEIYLGEFNTTLDIVPIDNTILATGQNSKIISMGNYICKVINYKTHSSLSSNSTDIKNCNKKYIDLDIDGDEYIFTGHCSHNIYPLNLINFPPWQDLDLGEQETYLYYPPEY